ncbi:tetratricopeptide repeat protein [Ahrensia sp. R2A130]|uniref:tetratricopeptide repeat protein n=1 Tax=Ahrensia sp. R2A130 TaxID=744979 RepID=UPI0001E0CA02|nr:tetratricopeptide repeat protein [Ahrensia sp. R2A130]EFL88814.1 TPR repeat-containing protein [Ahrensia sp. R2A130]
MLLLVRLTFAVLLSVVPAIGANAAFAQETQLAPGVDPSGDIDTGIPLPKVEKPEAKKPPPKTAFEFAKDLDGLFGQLKRTRDHKLADRISTQIWEKWQTSNSKSIDLLTHWARAASGRKQFDAALDLLDQVIVLRPEYAEGWNQRATLHFQRKDFRKSIADIEKVLALEPRHYGALSGLAVILEQLGNEKQALQTWYRVLSVYPSNRSAGRAVVRLEEELAGSGI